jgi:hypothetical protein
LKDNGSNGGEKSWGHLGKMMNDEFAAIAGKHEQLVGTLQEKYGIA